MNPRITHSDHSVIQLIDNRSIINAINDQSTINNQSTTWFSIAHLPHMCLLNEPVQASIV